MLFPYTEDKRTECNKSVYRHDTRHHPDILRMVTISQAGTNRWKQGENRYAKQRRTSQQAIQHGSVHPHRLLLLFLIDETEEPRLHAIRKQDQQQGCPTI